MATEIVRFPGEHGGRLAGRLHRPQGPARAYGLFAHCFTCSKDYKAVVWISRALVETGIAVLRFDFTGLGESEGEFADTNFSSNLEDLVAAAEFLDREYEAPQLLIGHSLGGTAVLAAAQRIPTVRGVATIAAPSDTEHLKKTLLDRAPELDAAEEETTIHLAGRPFRIGRQLLVDLEEHSMESAIAALDVPLIVLHSPDDRTVGIEHARRIFSAARYPKTFVSLDGADHLLAERKEDASFVADLLSAWAGRYLDSPEEVGDREASATAQGPAVGETEVGSVATGAGAEPGTVLASGGESGYAVAIAAGHHPLSADEPEALGGTDTGPNPYDLLLAALAACKAITMRMYADRKGWPLEATQLRLQHGKIHAQDCENCRTEKGRIDRIEVEIDLSGPLTEEQRQRIYAIADRCPVHRTLKSEIDIRSSLQP